MSYPRTRDEYAKDNRENRCDVCDDVSLIGVFQVPMTIPWSLGFCERCSNLGIIPYWLLLAAVKNDLAFSFVNQDLVRHNMAVRDRTLEFFGATLEEFERDVAA